MSRWTDRIQNHATVKLLPDAAARLDAIDAMEGLDEATIEGVARLRALISLAIARTAPNEPGLVPVAPLENMAQAVQTVVTELTTFTTDKNPAHISVANKHGDAILVQLGQIPAPTTSTEMAAIASMASAHRQLLIDERRRVSADAKKLAEEAGAIREKLAALQNDIASEKQRLSSIASDLQGQFSAAQETRLKEFSEGQVSRQKEFADALATVIGRANNAITGADERMNKAISDYEEKSQAALGRVEKSDEEASRLLGIIGTKGITTGYIETANYARNQSELWQKVTVGSIILLIGVALYAFVPVIREGKDTFGWEAIFARVFITLTVGVLAAFANSQAEKQLAIEKRNRKLGLELAALGPFVAPLPDKDKAEFRVEIGKRTFGRDDVDNHEKAPINVVDLADRLEKNAGFRELVARLVSRFLPAKTPAAGE